MAIAFIFIVLIMGDLLMASAFTLYLAIWQIMSAVVLLAANNGRGPRRWLFLAGWLGDRLSIIFSFQIISIVLPIVLIICYWLLTTCNLYPTMKYHKGKFLPHTSF